MQTELFAYPFRYAAGVDRGVKRSSNQDEVICCPEYGFFAVSDGMGGLRGGGETSAMLAKKLPEMIGEAYRKLEKKPSSQLAAKLLEEQLRLISDNIYKGLNLGGRIAYGATLCGVWLVGEHAVFANIGDSRGYLLEFYKKRIRQVTIDHNVAQLLVENGELSREEAGSHPASSTLTRFVGMESPALPETFTVEPKRGDMILLCSDGLYGMVPDARLPNLLRSSKNPNLVVKRLIDEANLAGGKDNISAVQIKILREKPVGEDSNGAGRAYAQRQKISKRLGGVKDGER
jgi:serine/threonine protein phosphatase PrpC